jgi:hypothetical protein
MIKTRHTLTNGSLSRRKKKPSSVGKRYLGQQHNYGHHAARPDYNSASRKKSSRPLPSPVNFYAAVIDGFSANDSDWAWGCCPFHDDHNPSFCMNLRTGWYQCKSSNCGETGNSIVRFVGARDGLSIQAAIRFLEGWI